MMNRADTGMTSAGRPLAHAARIFLAARSAEMEANGNLLAAVNRLYSAAWSPLNFAKLCEPVRIIPGVTVVT